MNGAFFDLANFCWISCGGMHAESRRGGSMGPTLDQCSTRGKVIDVDWAIGIYRTKSNHLLHLFRPRRVALESSRRPRRRRPSRHDFCLHEQATSRNGVAMETSTIRVTSVYGN